MPSRRPAEQLRADAIRTGNLDPFAMARAENLAARAKRALGLDKPPPEPPTSTTPLDRYLADRGAAS